MRLNITTTVCAAGLLATSGAWADTLHVGPGQTFGAPCDAIAAAADGDIIEIDAGGDYAGDVCGVSKNSLTLRGVNGRALLDAAALGIGGAPIDPPQPREGNRLGAHRTGLQRHVDRAAVQPPEP